MLQLGACTHATLAPDALAVILDESRGGPVNSIIMIFHKVKEYMLAERILIGQGLQLALLVLIALCAVSTVFREQQFNYMLACIPYLQSICVDIHPFSHGHCARSYQCAGSCLFHHAHTAVSRHTQIRVIAESGDNYTQLFGSIKNCCPFLYLYFLIIYLKSYHFFPY
jgi:hypothetical protein